MTELTGLAVAIVILALFTAAGRIRANARMTATANHYRRLRDQLAYPPVTEDLRVALTELAAHAAAHDDPSLMFAGQLLADRLRKRVGGADVSLAHVLQLVIQDADQVESWALVNGLDPFTATRYLLAAAATELSRWDRLVAVEVVDDRPADEQATP